MKPLDYQPSDASASTTDLVLLWLPVSAGLVTFVCLVHNVIEEPFGVFEITDAVVQVGGPLATFALWLSWLVVALRRRIRWVVLLPLCCWAGFNVWVAQWFIVGYFQEPWNY